MTKIINYTVVLILLITGTLLSQDTITKDFKIDSKLKLFPSEETEPESGLMNKLDNKIFSEKSLFAKDSVNFSNLNQRKVKTGAIEFDSAYIPKKNYLLPIGEVIVLNVGVWSISRYLNPQPWARISINSVRENFRKMWVWDADHFETNQFFHPYHGNTYFNFARSNGLSFWESVPYTAGGSLMWELFMETNYPSRNDFISTTLGGIALGEMTYRLSSLIIDERKSGGERFWRELGAFLLAPTRGINRLLSGDISRYRPKSIYEIEPVKSSITFGPSYFYEVGGIYRGNGNLSLRLDLYYGNPFIEKTRKPYDFFNIKGVFSIGTQPLISNVSAYGLIFGKNFNYKNDQKMLIGMFQHFDFYNNVYYKIGNNSLGGGIVYQFPAIEEVNFESSMHASFIVLGGGSNIREAFKYEADGTAYRDYNFGVGFSYKFESLLTLKEKGYLFLGLYNYRIYNISGADGNDNLLIFTPRIAIALTPNTNVGFEYNNYIRSSNYKKYDDFQTNVYEMKLFISNNF